MKNSFFLFSILFLLTCISIQAQTKDSIRTQKLSEVEISAQGKPSGALSSTPLQVVTSQTMLEQGMLSVSDAVKRFNGIVLKDYGGIGGLKTVSIRGMGAEHTAISYDGVMVNNGQSGQVDISRFALDNVSSVSLNIGQSDNIFQTAKAFASAGVLNLETIIPNFKKHDYTGHIKLTTGSFGLVNPSVNYAHKLNNTFVLSANGNWQRADGRYPFSIDRIDTERKRKNSDVNIWRGEMNLYSDFGKGGQLNTKVYYFDSERGLPGSVIYLSDYAAERLWNKNLFVQTSYKKNLSQKLYLKTQAKYDYVYTRYTDEQGSGKITNKYKEQEAYLSNAINYLLNENISFSLAEDLSYNQLKNEIQMFGDNLPLPKRYNSLTALAFQYKNERLTLTSSMLGTYISEKVENNRGDLTYKRLSPSIGVSYLPFEVTNVRIRASYKNIYRVPTFNELFYTSIEKKLKPEIAQQFNLGLTWVGSIANSAFKYINISADAHYNKVDDKIVIIPQTFVPSTMNIGKVEIKGIDLKIATNIAVNNLINIDLTTTYSYMQALDVTNKTFESYKKQIQYTPLHSGAATLSLNNPCVNFSYSVIAADKRYSSILNTKTSIVKEYTDHSISLFKKINLKENELYLQGSVQNIWNKNYEVIAFYPMPGRLFQLSAGYNF